MPKSSPGLQYMYTTNITTNLWVLDSVRVRSIVSTPILFRHCDELIGTFQDLVTRSRQNRYHCLIIFMFPIVWAIFILRMRTDIILYHSPVSTRTKRIAATSFVHFGPDLCWTSPSTLEKQKGELSILPCYLFNNFASYWCRVCMHVRSKFQQNLCCIFCLLQDMTVIRAAQG
jgi:hypothetical protein